MEGLWSESTVAFGCVLATVSGKLLLEVRGWKVCPHLSGAVLTAVLFAASVWFLSTPHYSKLLAWAGAKNPYIGAGNTLGIADHLSAMPIAFACMIVVPCVALTPDALWHVLQRWLSPTSVQVAQEWEFHKSGLVLQ
jgi:hypothetical protein